VEASFPESEFITVTTDSRIAQMRALIDDARSLAADMSVEMGPVDAARLARTRDHLNHALRSLDWFDHRYPDERP